MSKIKFYSMVFLFMNLKELTYASYALRILSPKLAAVLSDPLKTQVLPTTNTDEWVLVLQRNLLFKLKFMFLSQVMHPRFNGENLDKNKLLYSQFANLAAKHACTTPQLALAWLLHQGIDIIPIPGIVIYFLLNAHHFDTYDWISLFFSWLCKK